jgi:hypothetical protein
MEIRRLIFREARTANDVCSVILEDAASCIEQVMYPFDLTQVRDVECAEYIGPNRLLAIALAPVDIRPTRHS